MSERIEINGQVHIVPEPLAGYVSALRKKCAELKKERDSYMLLSKMRPRPFADTDAGLVAQVAELQRQLDAAPPNLPALIEQAKREERERIGKLIHYPKCWDTAAYPELEDALTEIHFCTQCYSNREESIRARTTGIEEGD